MKVTIGAALVLASVVVAFFTGGATLAAAVAAAKMALVELSVGIGFAAVGWVISSVLSGDWSLGNLENSIADAVFFTGVFMFISASVSAIKSAARAYNVSKAESSSLAGYELDP